MSPMASVLLHSHQYFRRVLRMSNGLVSKHDVL
ncbi:MAG: hypothetical protein ACI927_000384 [Oceanospirillaceae bacterium]|jgi:hypothetical protein